MNLRIFFSGLCFLISLLSFGQNDETNRKDSLQKKSLGKDKTVTPVLKETQAKEVEIQQQKTIPGRQDSLPYKQAPSNNNKPLKINEKDCPVV